MLRKLGNIVVSILDFWFLICSCRRNVPANRDETIGRAPRDNDYYCGGMICVEYEAFQECG